jgi:sigma-B regulation protein RsbQ
MTNVIKRNNVTVTGKGAQPMMFAHGFGCDQNMWRYILPSFESDYKIILFDHVGAGKSDLAAYDREKYGKLDGYASDVLKIIDALKLNNVIFVGHSVSCMIGQLAANERPDLFSSLIHIGPSPRYINDEGYKGGFARKDLEGLLEMMDSNYLGWSGTVGPMIMGNADRPELGQELTNSFCATDPEIAKHFARVTFFSDNREDLPKSKVPALIMQCAQDIIAPEEVGRYMHEHTPLTTLHLMKATGHCPHVSHPIETVNVMKKYLVAIKQTAVE